MYGAPLTRLQLEHDGETILESCKTAAGQMLIIASMVKVAGALECTLSTINVSLGAPSLLSCIGKGSLAKMIRKTEHATLSKTEKDPVVEKFENSLSTVVQVLPPTYTQKRKLMQKWMSQAVEMAEMDKEYTAMLLDESQTPDELSFSTCFVDWLNNKQDKLRLTGTHVERIPFYHHGQDVGMNHWPHLELPIHSASALASRLLSNPDTFWPRPVIEYLIFTGYLHSATCEVPLIKAILAKGDLRSLKYALSHTPDLTPADLLSVLEYVTLSANAAKLEEFIDQGIDRIFEKQKRMALKNRIELTQPAKRMHPAHFKTTRGQHYFMPMIFTYAAKHIIAIPMYEMTAPVVVLDWISDLVEHGIEFMQNEKAFAGYHAVQRFNPGDRRILHFPGCVL
jgi:hypothetical protein